MAHLLIDGGQPLPAALSCKSVEYYTPPVFIDAVYEVMGGVDCDPASNDLANGIIGATVYYTKETNGLDKPWIGRVFCNPPYGKEGSRPNQATWSQRLIEQYQAGITTEAILLVNAATETQWFQPLWNYPICFPKKRVDFWIPDGTNSHATHASVFVYMGPNNEKFIDVFRHFGRVVRTVDIPPYTGLWRVV